MRTFALAAGDAFSLPDLDDVVPGARTRRGATTDLDRIHFDTVERELTRLGVTLLHERHGPREEWSIRPATATGSSARGAAGPWGRAASVGRSEPGPVDRPPREMLVELGVSRTELSRVARSFVVRRRTVVVAPSGEAWAEVDDEQVSVFAGGRVARRFRRVAVTVAGSAPAGTGAFVAARLLRSGAVLAPPTPEVATVTDVDGHEPGHTPFVTDGVRGGDDVSAPSVGVVLGGAVAGAVAELLDAHSRGDHGFDVETIHDLRVAARRLRALLKIFRPLFEDAGSDGKGSDAAGLDGKGSDGAVLDATGLDGTGIDGRRRELRELGRTLGAVRDLDVVRSRLLDGAVVSLGPDDATNLDDMTAELDRQRDRAVQRWQAARADPRYGALLDGMVDLALRPRLVEPSRRADEAMAPLVRRRWRKVHRRGRDLGPRDPGPTDPAPQRPAPVEDEAHDLRKRLKELRYATEACEPFAKGARSAARRVSRAQRVLGEVVDSRATEAWLRRWATRDAGVEGAFAAGALTAHQNAAAAEVWRRWPDRWKAARRRRGWRWAR